MTHLLHVKRALTACLVAALFPVLMVAHANAGPVPSPLSTSSQARTYPFTAAMAARWPGCVAHMPTGVVPSGFLVERMSGHFEVMPFADAWHRWHDKSHADDIWTFAQCTGERMGR